MNSTETNGLFLLNNAEPILHELHLRPPQSGIPLTLNADGKAQNVRIEVCREHFAPMIDIITRRCNELGLTIQCTGSLTGTVYIRESDPEPLNALMQTIIDRNYHEECSRADTLIEAAMNILPATSDMEIMAIREHIRRCAYCSWMKMMIINNDAQDGPALTKDIRIFDASYPSPLDILLEQRKS